MLDEIPSTVVSPFSNFTNDSSSPVHSQRSRNLFEILFWFYILVGSVFGIALNVYCVSTLKQLSRRFRLKHVAQTLCTIAVSDICALILILVGHLRLNRHTENHYVLLVFCKVHTFLLHSLSAYSTWCWVLLSLIRYLAVFHPYKHMMVQFISVKFGLSFTLLCCMGVEGWTLVFVRHERLICTMNFELMSLQNFQNLSLADAVLTYVAPLVCIISLNAAVFAKLHVYSRRGAKKMIQIRADSLVPSETPNGYSSGAVLSKCREKRLRKQKIYFLIRLIVLVAVNLLLNLPNYIIRLLNVYGVYGTILSYPANHIVQKLSYALSYTHYGVNCFYTRFTLNGHVERKPPNSREFSATANGSVMETSL